MIMLIKSRHLVISLCIFVLFFFFHIHVLEAYINKIDFKAFFCTLFRNILILSVLT